MIRSFLLRLIAFAVVLLLGLELFFRLVLPSAEMPAGYQIPEWKIMALDASVQQNGHHSIGRLGQPVFQWDLNNYGFISAIDYKQPSERSVPCAVVVGSSYVQGLYSDSADNLAGRLHADFQGSVEVYNLGTSGMPLSQSPRVVAFAAHELSPDLIILQASASSLVRSLRNNGKVALCQQLSWQDGTLTRTPPSPLRISKFRRAIRKSAIVRYLFYNANVNLGGKGDVVKPVDGNQKDKPGTLDGIALEVYDQVLDDIFAEIRSLTSAPIFLVFDANRKAMYTAGKKPSRLRESPPVEAGCKRNGVYFLDLTETFWQEYEASGKSLNFAENYHWNPNTVKLVAGAVRESLEHYGLVRNNHLILDKSYEKDLGASSP